LFCTISDSAAVGLLPLAFAAFALRKELKQWRNPSRGPGPDEGLQEKMSNKHKTIND